MTPPAQHVQRPVRLPRTDYRETGLPDDAAAHATAVDLASIIAAAGDPDAWAGPLFSHEAVAHTRASRFLSGSWDSKADALLDFVLFREGLHPGRATRVLLFPRPIPRRAVVRIRRADLARFFR